MNADTLEAVSYPKVTASGRFKCSELTALVAVKWVVKLLLVPARQQAPRSAHAANARHNQPLNGQGICSCHNPGHKGRGDCVHLLIADGSVTNFKNDAPPKTINAMLTIAGGETVVPP